MKPGIYSDLTNAEYHGGPGVSKSMLDIIADRSPLHLHHIRTNQDAPRESTPAQMLGTAFHALVLEPHEFIKAYCLAPRQSDTPDAIDGRDRLVAMVEELNVTRLPKLSGTGTKDELVARINAACLEHAERGLPGCDAFQADAAKIADLKTYIGQLNAVRPPLLSVQGSMEELATILRENGKPVTLWKDIKAEWLRNNGHRLILEPEEWDQLHRMRDAVMAHPAACALLTSVPGKAEQSVYWVDAKTGELCRCRPDWWRADNILVDVKTTEDASPQGFAKSLYGWRYHVQHPFYLDGVNAALQQGGCPRWLKKRTVQGFVFLAVEKTARVVDGQAMGVAVYVLDAEGVELGRLEYERDLAEYARCRQSGTWPGYDQGLQDIKLPQYAFTRAAALLDAAQSK